MAIAPGEATDMANLDRFYAKDSKVSAVARARLLKQRTQTHLLPLMPFDNTENEEVAHARGYVEYTPGYNHGQGCLPFLEFFIGA